jgi:hypothetical protein
MGSKPTFSEVVENDDEIEGRFLLVIPVVYKSDYCPNSGYASNNLHSPVHHENETVSNRAPEAKEHSWSPDSRALGSDSIQLDGFLVFEISPSVSGMNSVCRRRIDRRWMVPQEGTE